jgi:hypothetical protein
MNLEAKTISGYVKGYSYNIGDSFEGKESNHAWNMVKINGEWRIFDATWGGGYGITNSNGKLVSISRFTDEWFNASPNETIFSHYPKNNLDLLINSKLTLKNFESIPIIEISAFKTRLLDAEETLDLFLNDKKYAAPNVYSLNTFIKVIQAPKYGVLSKNTRYNFEFYVPRAKSIMLIDEAGNYVQFKKSDNEPIYTLNYSQKSPGVFSIVMDFYNEKNPLTFIKYTIK